MENVWNEFVSTRRSSEYAVSVGIKYGIAYRSSLEMSTPTVWMGLSILVLITEAKFLSINRNELQPAVKCL